MGKGVKQPSDERRDEETKTAFDQGQDETERDLQEKQHLQGPELEREREKTGKDEKCRGQGVHGVKTRDSLCRRAGEASGQGQDGGQAKGAGERAPPGPTGDGAGAAGGEKGSEESGQDLAVQNGFNPGPTQRMPKAETTSYLTQRSCGWRGKRSGQGQRRGCSKGNDTRRCTE